MPISSIVNKVFTPVYKQSSKFFNKVAETSFVKNKMDAALKDPVRTAGKMLVLSIVSKDVVGGVFYTTQSWNNQKIPKKKRHFVAMGDATNCLVMVGGQMLAGLGVDRVVVPWINSKFTGTMPDAKNNQVTVDKKGATDRVFHDDKIKEVISKVVKEKEKVLGEAALKDFSMEKAIKDVSKKAKDPVIGGLTIIVTTLLTNALIKRTAAPLISTPMAGFITDNFFKEDGDETKKETVMDPVAVSNKYYNKDGDEFKAFKKFDAKKNA